MALSLATAFGDVISGTVTDADAGTPLAGVKISVNANTSVQSGATGVFTLNTAPAALIVPNGGSPSRREGRVGAFLWAGGKASADGEVRNLLGARLLTLPSEPGTASIWGNASVKALTKVSALNTLQFEKSGYTTMSQQVDGSQSGLSVKMKKAAAARKANLTWFESYPDPGSEECIKYNGCTWAGQFAAVSGKQPESWVKANNIAAVHEKDFAKYKLKTLRLVQGTKTIDVKVYDMCSDSDCDGCCTQNAGSAGFLIDVEKYTAERFGTRSGTVDWTCVDCTN